MIILTRHQIAALLKIASAIALDVWLLGTARNSESDA
jgi:hypothetical protein